MKKIIAASILFTACGNSVPDKITLSVEQEKAPPACLALDGSCSEITTTTIDKNGVNTVKTEEPCDDAPVASPAVLATPAPTPAPVVVQTPAPFVPHYTAMVHPLPVSYDPVFSLQATVEFDINNNRIIDGGSEQFIVTFYKLADNSVVSTVAYGNQLEFYQEKYWYPNEFVNDKKPFSTATQPWEEWVINSDGERTNLANAGGETFIDVNAQYSFQAWAPLGNTDFRAKAFCWKQNINGHNCGIIFDNVSDKTSLYYTSEGTGSLPVFSDGVSAQVGGFKGRHLSGLCLIGGSTGLQFADTCVL
jgi:hypothetical protein